MGGMSTPGPRAYLKTLASLTRIDLLHVLQIRGAQTIVDLAARTGLHPNTVREHLHRLVQIGLVRSDPILRGRRGRPTLRYRVAFGVGRDRTRAQDPPRQLERLSEHLERCGFDATIDSGAGRVTLWDCPFARMSESSPQVCEVHHSLIVGVLESVPGPVEAGKLCRLVTARECTLTLAVGQPSPRESDKRNM